MTQRAKVTAPNKQNAKSQAKKMAIRNKVWNLQLQDYHDTSLTLRHACKTMENRILSKYLAVYCIQH